MTHSSPLLERKFVAHETLSILVRRPEAFEFRAGQYVDLTIFGAPHRDALGPTRSMSIASPPGAGHLEFVMRVRGSAFKRNIAEVPLGTEVMIEGPMDDLRFAPDDREHVFIAGGVGIAPFLSILRETSARGDDLSGTLFYANRRPGDALYLEELERTACTIAGLRIVPTMTADRDSIEGWAGERERPGAALLRKHLSELVGPAYYIAGSPMFISHLRRVLLAEGVSDVDIGLEMYAGY